MKATGYELLNAVVMWPLRPKVKKHFHRSLWLVFCIMQSSNILAQQSLDFDKYKVLDEISTRVKDHFYQTDFDTLAWNQQVNKCRVRLADITTLDGYDLTLNELLATLNASHTYLYTRNNPKRYQLMGVFHKLYDDKDSSLFCYEGIGVDTKQIDGKTFITGVYDGFPAEKAGLLFGDQIVTVDQSPFHPMHSFLSKANSEVIIEVVREQQTHSFSVPVEILDGRTMFEKAMDASMQIFERNGKSIGYLHLWSYAGVKYQELMREAVLWGKLSKCDALVVDLRDGWGGADINYLNLFRKPIAKIQSTTRAGDHGSYSGVWEKPIALLVNGKSTSGKELFTYGFKKLNLGLVIGEQTAGAVLAGRVFALSSGDVLYLAVHDVEVDGKHLEGNGVQPDVLVKRPLAYNEVDPQLEKALQVLSD